MRVLAGLSDGFASNFGVRVDLEVRIQDSVRNLIAHLIGMTFTHGFRSEQHGIAVMCVKNVTSIHLSRVQRVLGSEKILKII